MQHFFHHLHVEQTRANHGKERVVGPTGQAWLKCRRSTYSNVADDYTFHAYSDKPTS